MPDHPPDDYRVVKMLARIVAKAEVVARRRASAKNPKRRLSLADYLSAAVESIVDKDYAAELEAMQREMKQIRKKAD